MELRHIQIDIYLLVVVVVGCLRVADIFIDHTMKLHFGQ